MSESYDGENFFTKGADGVRMATPLLLALAVVEISDVVFAVDSIPAVRCFSTCFPCLRLFWLSCHGMPGWCSSSTPCQEVCRGYPAKGLCARRAVRCLVCCRYE